jgi:cation/acetate symporter
MHYVASNLAIGIFLAFVGFVLGLSFYFARKAKSAEGYFAAGGTVPWWLNGVAFAGDYLSAASFLGICGMIATAGYDGFLYSIGYLAGWVVALFVVAEPMKRLGKYTFTDALDSKFNSKSIQLVAAISTLVVSMCYLIPQMVGAGSLVTPLLGWEHKWGVILVGAIVVIIVATAGMTSTTYVQFLKGALLIVFSSVLCVSLFKAGFNKFIEPEIRKEMAAKNKDNKDYVPYHEFAKITGITITDDTVVIPKDAGYEYESQVVVGKDQFICLKKDDALNWWVLHKDDVGKTITLNEIPSKSKLVKEETITFKKKDGDKMVEATVTTDELYNGYPKEAGKFYQTGHFSKLMMDGKPVSKTGPVGPFKFLEIIKNSEIVRFKKVLLVSTTEKLPEGRKAVTVWKPVVTSGSVIMRPGLKFKVDKGATFWSKLNFISLMLALFFGTSALPHVLIRYYTVPSQRDARKSTIVAIGAIGFFYILTMFMGLGAMVNGVIDLNNTNMSAPLMAKMFGVGLFSIISAIAFATVLGTVSGLIVAASGAVAHDLMDNYMGMKLSDAGKVKAGKIASLATGVVAIALGIAFETVNVSFLVGWAFAVAASANLPAIMMLLFWDKTTAKGIAASVGVGMVAAVSILAVSPRMSSLYLEWWGVKFGGWIPLNQPGIISIPLAFITLVVVSLMTQKDNENKKSDEDLENEA